MLEDARVAPCRRRATTGSTGPTASSATRLDVRVDRLRALVEVGLLLAREVVVEPVDDEDRDEQQGQRDDGHEGAGQATLEGSREEPAQSTREAGAAAPRVGQRSANA